MHALIILAAIYGTLNAETNLVKAPRTVVVDGCYRGTDTITEPQANALGYKLVEDFPPACASNEYAVATGWDETNRIYRTYEKNSVVPLPRKFSKLKIYTAISTLGGTRSVASADTWAIVKAWLEAKEIGGVNGWTAFVLAQEISEDHPLFTPLAEEARQLLGLSEMEFDLLLNACLLD